MLYALSSHKGYGYCMTICVSVKVSEGLVLAADSTAVVQGQLLGHDGAMHSGILKTYEHARKLSHVKDYPIGTLSWGTALIGSRSVESLIKEYEYSLTSLKEEEEKLREGRMKGNTGLDARHEFSVKAIAEGLLKHIWRYYDSVFSDTAPEARPLLGVLVSGYSSGHFFPEQWLITLPNSSELQALRPNVEGKPDFGANWFGLTDAIVRLHWGRDEQVISLLSAHFQLDPAKIAAALHELQYPVLFDGMPLQDAIDYAVYLVNIVIGRHRFVIGAPLCGGDIDVAVITPNAFTWIQRKSWKIKNLPFQS